MQRSGSVAAGGPAPQRTYALFLVLQSFSHEISCFLDGMWVLHKTTLATHKDGRDDFMAWKGQCINKLFRHIQHYSGSFTNSIMEYMRHHESGETFEWPTVKDWRTSDLNILGYLANVGRMVYPVDLPGGFSRIMCMMDTLVQSAYAIQCDLRIGAFPLRDIQLLLREMTANANLISIDVFGEAVKKLDGTGIIYAENVAPERILYKIACDLEKLDDVDAMNKAVLSAGMQRVNARRDELEARAVKGASIRSGANAIEAAGAAATEEDDEGDLQAELEKAQEVRDEERDAIRRTYEWVKRAGDDTMRSPTESEPSSPCYSALSPRASYEPRSPTPGFVPRSPISGAKRRITTRDMLAEEAPFPASSEPVKKRAAVAKARTVLAKSKRGVSSRGPSARK